VSTVRRDFELVVAHARPWATRTERREVRRARVVTIGAAAMLAALTVSLVFVLWHLWASTSFVSWR
jgi:hypothetical protein